VVKLSVSPTTPYTSKIILKGCISHDNRYGIHVAARNVILSDCIISNNERHGVQMFDSIFITLNGCHIIKNSASSAGTYAGLFLSGCSHVEVNGGVINGSDSELLQNEDGSALTKYHLYGVWIKETATCDHLYIRHTTILNFTSTRGVYVDNFTLPAYANKLIVMHVGDIGSNPLNNQIGSYGSSLYKDGRKYTKNTNLNSVIWDMELRTAYGSESVSADGTATTFPIAHQLGTVPLKFRITSGNSGACGDFYVTSDATHLYVSFVTAPPSGTLLFQWEASA
jgi:parallel beta-helix repeat protein